MSWVLCPIAAEMATRTLAKHLKCLSWGQKEGPVQRSVEIHGKRTLEVSPKYVSYFVVFLRLSRHLYSWFGERKEYTKASLGELRSPLSSHASERCLLSGNLGSGGAAHPQVLYLPGKAIGPSDTH